MSVQELLVNHLDDLIAAEFKRFKWFLTTPNDGKAIPKSHLENADQMDTVSKMVENYGEKGALEVTLSILRKQRMNDLAERLQNAYRGQSSAASSTISSSVVTPAAGPSLLAQGGSVIVAPVVSNSSGTWNITIKKD